MSDVGVFRVKRIDAALSVSSDDCLRWRRLKAAEISGDNVLCGSIYAEDEL